MTSPKQPARAPAPGSRRTGRRRAADAPVILMPLDTAAGRSLQRQVYDGVREAILAGRLPPGARLPSTRTLASELGVSRTTVVAAFDQLRAEGYVAGRHGDGTRVRAAVPDAVLDIGRTAPSRRRPPAPAAIAGAIGTRDPETTRTAPVRLSERGSMLVRAGAQMAPSDGRTPAPFRLGVPAVDAFPARLWARLTARRWRHGDVHLGDADPGGEPALRAAIATYVANARGTRCTADQVIVVSGTQQALDLTARVLLDVGDAAWLEDPGYPGARAAFASAGARIVPVPVDDEGLDVSAGERAAPDARLAYVTPSHQFPLGAVMSAPRRLSLLAWARRSRAWVVEDDYDSEFRYSGRPLPCLQGLDASPRSPGEPTRVLYVGTFNKTLVPGIRMGYLVVPDVLTDALRAARAAADRHPPTFTQGVLADFIGEGHYARHVRRLRALYAERQSVLLAAAAEELSGVLTLTPDPAGLHLVAWLPPSVSDIAAEHAARVHGVEVSALSRYTITPSATPSRQALLLSYAAFDERAIRAGMRRLRRALGTLRVER